VAKKLQINNTPVNYTERCGYRFLKIAALLAVFLLFISLNSCSLFKSTSNNDEETDTPSQETSGETIPPAGIYDVDPKTGLAYFIPEEFTQNFTLPDGSAFKMVMIPGGEFVMGLNDEDPLGIQPAGNIRMSVNAFWMSQTEVTNAQYRGFLNSLPPDERKEMLPDSTAWDSEVGGIPWAVYFRDSTYQNYPVTSINWHQASRFAEWADMSLPLEVEWEFAARSGISGRIYPWDGIYTQDPQTGQFLANYAHKNNPAADGYAIPAPVGSFRPNNFRLYDMAGNVSEWCKDAYFPSYRILKLGLNDMVNPSYQNEKEARKVVRGGSWDSSHFFIGVGYRNHMPAGIGSARTGIRLVKHNVSPEMRQKAMEAFRDMNTGSTNRNIIFGDGRFPVEAETEPANTTKTAGDTTATGEPAATPEEEPGFFKKLLDSLIFWN